MRKFLYFLLGAFTMIAGTVYAINVTVPQATQYGQILIGNSNGTYTPAATSTLGILQNVATSSAETSTYLPFWTSTSGTPATLSGGTSDLTWDGVKLFANKASTTQTSVSDTAWFPSGIWNSSGKVGIGNTSPTQKLDVAGFINTDQYSGYKQAGNTILSASSTNYSTLVGNSAGNALLSDGLYNTAIGYQAALVATSTDYLTAIGYRALYSNTVGTQNTAIGTQALQSNTTGNYNFAMGVNSLASNTTGSQNVALGNNTLNANVSGSSNIAIGYLSQYAATASNNVSIGDTTLRFVTSAPNNVAVGSGSQNRLVSGAGRNTGVGYYSLFWNNTGIDNTAVGYAALSNHTNATSSIALGSYAGMGVTTPTSIGSTYLGYYAGYSAGAGNDYNTMVGYQAGRGVTTGSTNILIGKNAGYSGTNLLTGTGNIMIGNDIGARASDMTNSLNIGNAIFGTGLTGTGTTIAGNIGIGTASPYARFSVQGASNGAAKMFELSNSASTTLAHVLENGTAYFLGNVGIGTTTPYAKLSVAGDIVGNAITGAYFTATSSTATSALAGNLTVAGNSTFNYTSTTKEPMGFPNTTDSNISFNNATRVFSIAPVSTSYSYWSHGLKYSTTTTASVTIPATANSINYFYMDSAGNLAQTTDAPTFLDNTQVASIYWDGAKGYLGYDRHPLTMDNATHKYLHLTVGAKIYGGFTGTFNTGNTFSLTGGTFIDEDNYDTWSATTTQRIWNRYGTTWKWSDKTTQIASTTGTDLLYDNAGTPTAVNANQYVAMWIFATNGQELMAVMGQRQDTTLANAQANNTYASLALGTLPVPEMKLLYRVIMRNNTPTYTMAEALDYRTAGVTGSTFTATAHNLLTGLDYASSGHTGFLSSDNASSTNLSISGYFGLFEQTWASLVEFVTWIKSLFSATYPLTYSSGTFGLSPDMATSTTYFRWSDKMSIPQATTTDETAKFGSCLESGDKSVTITKIDTLIASSTMADASAQGITWNLNIGNTTSSTSPMTAFTVNRNSYGTSTVQTFVPNGTATIPAGYCYWLTFGTASTSQIQMLYVNLWGNKN